MPSCQPAEGMRQRLLKMIRKRCIESSDFPRRIEYSLLPLSCRKTRIFKPLYTVCFLGVGSDQSRES